MHEYRKSPHEKLQRRILIGTIIFAIVAAAIVTPLITNGDLRYDLAMRFGMIPGGAVEKLADGEDDALLVILPLDNGTNQITPWLFRAQFIAWPIAEGIDLENLETGDRLTLPLERLEFISSNGDGSLVLVRGQDASTGESLAFTINPSSMDVDQLADPDAVPDEPGDWETSIWDKQAGWCHRPSPNRRFLACFVPADLASYAAGDWELGVQFWGDYEELHPIFRGQGFLLPFVGFAHNDTVMYFQNELGIWRAEIPDDILEIAPAATPLATPQP